jgi:hypothetical protein
MGHVAGSGLHLHTFSAQLNVVVYWDLLSRELLPDWVGLEMFASKHPHWERRSVH